MGEKAVISFMPVWILSFIYPFMKRLIPFPQVVLGAAIGAAVLPGWVAVTDDLDYPAGALPLFLATTCWVIYFDVLYATQDSEDDAKIGVKSLAVLMGDHVKILLSVLAAMQVVLFALTAMEAHMSLIFWILGVGVWTVNLLWHILSLDNRDRKSGGRIFKANIKLGLHLTVVSVVELVFNRVDFGGFF